MNLSQFPERYRAQVLSGIVRNHRAGIAVRFGDLEGRVLPLTVRRDKPTAAALPPTELEQLARSAFGDLPYELVVYLEELPQ